VFLGLESVLQFKGRKKGQDLGREGGRGMVGGGMRGGMIQGIRNEDVKLFFPLTLGSKAAPLGF
jgi:ribosomal protein L15